MNQWLRIMNEEGNFGCPDSSQITRLFWPTMLRGASIARQRLCVFCSIAGHKPFVLMQFNASDGYRNCHLIFHAVVKPPNCLLKVMLSMVKGHTRGYGTEFKSPWPGPGATGYLCTTGW